MAKKRTETFTMIPNTILDDPALDPYEFRVLLHIARQTIGYGKKSDGISLSQFAQATGMSKSKIIRSLAALEDRGYIKKAMQKRNDGGHSFNRYSLKVVSGRYKGSVSQIQGVVSDRHTQKKIEQNMRETESYSRGFILDVMDENERKRETDLYAKEVSRSASKPEAYAVKIKKQINKRHTETCEAFEDWYITKECVALNDAFAGLITNGYEIEVIYSYLDTGRYDSSMKFLLQTTNASGKQEIRAYPSKKALEADIEGGLSSGEVVG